jgi:hypothetical protein
MDKAREIGTVSETECFSHPREPMHKREGLGTAAHSCSLALLGGQSTAQPQVSSLRQELMSLFGLHFCVTH